MQSVNKQQISVQLPLSTINKIESLKKLDDGKTSRNKIIESAVDFYFGYKTSEITQDYLCSIVGQKNWRYDKQCFKQNLKAAIQRSCWN